MGSAHGPTRGRCSAARHLLVASAIAAVIGGASGGATAEDMAVGGVPSVATHLPAATADPPVPVTVIDRRDIELSGMKSLGDFFEREAYNSFGLHRTSVAGGRAILVNGRRVPATGFGLYRLPISAVERIEILRDSAAALHGGHAAGGAINIVLRRDHEGIEVQAGADRPAAPGGDAEHASVLWGGGVGRGHVTIGAELFRREEIREAHRDFSRASYTPGGPFAGTTGVSARGNTLVFGVTRPDGSEATSYGILGECSEDVYTGPLTLSGGEVCGFAYADSAWLFGHSERHRYENLFLAADHPLGGGAELYVDARVARGEVLGTLFAPPPDQFDYALSDELKERLASTPGTPEGEISTDATLLHRFVAHGNRGSRREPEDLDLAVGVRGRFGNGVGHDVWLRFYRNDAPSTGGTYVSEPLILEAIANGRYDVANPLDPDLDAFPEHWDAVRDTSVRSSHDRVTEHTTARVAFDGASLGWRSREIRWAAGTEFAWEDYRNLLEYRDAGGNLVPAEDVLGSSGGSETGERRRWSVFTEAAVPVLDAWDVTVAGRHDDPDDVGATFSWGVANRFQASDALAFRASWSEGGQAPIVRPAESRSNDYVTDPLDSGCDPCQVEFVTAGDANREPDEMRTLNLGVAADLGHLSLSLDWFRIRVSGSPGSTLSAPQILELVAEGSPLPPGTSVVRNPAGAIDHIRAARLNDGEYDAAGIDVRAGAGWDAGLADVRLDGRWLRTTRDEYRVGGRQRIYDFPRDRLHASLRASRGDVTALWSIHAISGYRNESTGGRYNGWSGHDVVVQWRDAFGFDGLDLGAGVINIGDREPPIDSASPDLWNLRLDSALGRTLFLSAKVSFDP